MLKRFTRSLVRWMKDDSGPTAVEYAVLLALIIVVCVAGITQLGRNANQAYSYIGSSIISP